MATQENPGASDPRSMDGLPALTYEIYLLIVEAFLDNVEGALAESIMLDPGCHCIIENRVLHTRAEDPHKQFWTGRFRLIQSISQVNQRTRGMALRIMFQLSVVPCEGERYLTWFCPKVDFMRLGFDPWKAGRQALGDAILPLPGLQNVTRLRVTGYEFLQEFGHQKLELIWATFPRLESFVLTTCGQRLCTLGTADELLLDAGMLVGLGNWDSRQHPRATWTATWDRGIRVFIVEYGRGLEHESIKPTMELGAISGVEMALELKSENGGNIQSTLRTYATV
ncbi:hypothetical protein CkaCkLH20_06535 [Colletotrichum karsti]|uniref:Uncharacterized protein n=1 Tax=Colletotrichum karsti TaxID=1095194 RepID=A0A9P6LHB6_9PEZI|nr:uncharacterized protein CkaCkLH20_06535 [Colletotrichum karsti]KAF9876089.1 hypothetical protein CkaCkLH20_06535 [Colletotrichum karsti]